LQTQQKGKIGLIKMGIKVLKSDGIFGLYNGLTASLLRQVVSCLCSEHFSSLVIVIAPSVINNCFNISLALFPLRLHRMHDMQTIVTDDCGIR